MLYYDKADETGGDWQGKETDSDVTLSPSGTADSPVPSLRARWRYWLVSLHHGY